VAAGGLAPARARGAGTSACGAAGAGRRAGRAVGGLTTLRGATLPTRCATPIPPQKPHTPQSPKFRPRHTHAHRQLCPPLCQRCPGQIPRAHRRRLVARHRAAGPCPTPTLHRTTSRRGNHMVPPPLLSLSSSSSGTHRTIHAAVPPARLPAGGCRRRGRGCRCWSTSDVRRKLTATLPSRPPHQPPESRGQTVDTVEAQALAHRWQFRRRQAAAAAPTVSPRWDPPRGVGRAHPQSHTLAPTRRRSRHNGGTRQASRITGRRCSRHGPRREAAFAPSPPPPPAATSAAQLHRPTRRPTPARHPDPGSEARRGMSGGDRRRRRRGSSPTRGHATRHDALPAVARPAPYHAPTPGRADAGPCRPRSRRRRRRPRVCGHLRPPRPRPQDRPLLAVDSAPLSRRCRRRWPRRRRDGGR
jgi:hypothetical protein